MSGIHRFYSTVLRTAVAIPRNGSKFNALTARTSQFNFSSAIHLSSVQDKFVKLFLDYQEKNGSPTMFPRLVKEMVYAVDLNHDGMISEDELVHMMEHIGIERKLSNEEMKTLFQEMGEDVTARDEKQIPTHSVEELLLSYIRP